MFEAIGGGKNAAERLLFEEASVYWRLRFAAPLTFWGVGERGGKGENGGSGYFVHYFFTSQFQTLSCAVWYLETKEVDTWRCDVLAKNVPFWTLVIICSMFNKGQNTASDQTCAQIRICNTLRSNTYDISLFDQILREIDFLSGKINLVSALHNVMLKLKS